MTPAEHARRIQRTLEALEAATRAHHAALAALVAEHGSALGVEPEIVQLAALPKTPPPNPGGSRE
jgi:hypothetical protein